MSGLLYRNTLSVSFLHCKIWESYNFLHSLLIIQTIAKSNISFLSRHISLNECINLQFHFLSILSSNSFSYQFQSFNYSSYKNLIILISTRNELKTTTHSNKWLSKLTYYPRAFPTLSSSWLCSLQMLFPTLNLTVKQNHQLNVPEGYFWFWDSYEIKSF